METPVTKRQETIKALRADPIERNIQYAVEQERERCARIADAQAIRDQERYKTESDWRQPYAYNRVIRASMDIAAAIRNPKG